MDSAAQGAPPSLSSDQTKARKTFRNELTACLTLVAPVGMTEEAKRDWLAVAWDTLKHLPPDIFTIGAHKARESCDHPAKIVPTIINATADMMRWRREKLARDAELRALPAPKHDVCNPAEAAAVVAKFLKPGDG